MDFQNDSESSYILYTYIKVYMVKSNTPIKYKDIIKSINKMTYTCDVCEKDFVQKTDYTRHKNRKRPCVAPDIKEVSELQLIMEKMDDIIKSNTELEKPEYNNIYISNRKNMNKNIMVYENGEWCLRDISYIDKLYLSGVNFIEEKYDDLKMNKVLSRNTINVMDKFIAYINGDESENNRDVITNKLRTVLYNNKPKKNNI